MDKKAKRAIDIHKYTLDKGIFFIETEDYFFEEYALDYFRSLVDEQAKAFDLVELTQPSFAQIADRLSAYSLFGGNSVTIVKDFNTKLQEQERQQLALFSKQIPDCFFLVFSSGKGLIGADKAFMEPISAAKGTHYELSKFINSLYPNVIDNAALAKLIDYTDRDMVRINMELAKLVDYVGGRLIRVQDIEEMVAPDMEYKVYEFTNAVAARQYRKAIEIIEALSLSGLGTSALFRALIRQYQRMFYARTSSLGEDALGKKLEIKPYAVIKTKEAAARYSSLQLMNILGMLKQKEQDYRIGKTSDKQAFASAVSLLSTY